MVRRLLKQNPLYHHLEQARLRRLVTDGRSFRDYVTARLRDDNPDFDFGNRRGVRVGVIWDADRFTDLLEVRDPDIQVLRIPRAVVNPGWQLHLGRYLARTKNLVPSEFILERFCAPENDAARERFRTYLCDVWTLLMRDFGVDVFVTPKLNDDWAVDGSIAMRRVGAKLLVDDREGVVTPLRFKTMSPRIRALRQSGRLQSGCDVLVAHNDTHRRYLVAGGSPAESIVVNGAPQMDYWFRPRRWKTRRELHPDLDENRKLILFFSFSPRTYIYDFNFETGEFKGWDSLCEDHHAALDRLFERFGDKVQVVYKTSSRKNRDLFPGMSEYYRRWRKYVESKSLLLLDGRYNSMDLVRLADGVLGFQTSGMIEAMFTDNAIVYGGFGGFFEEMRDELVPFHRTEAVMRPRSREELIEALSEVVRGGFTADAGIREARRDFREQYFPLSDGNVSKRLLDLARALARGERPARPGATALRLAEASARAQAPEPR